MLSFQGLVSGAFLGFVVLSFGNKEKLERACELEAECGDRGDRNLGSPQGHWFFFFLLFYYSYVHTRLGSILPPAPTPSLTTHSTLSRSPPLNTQQKLFCPYL
jgi:hypothetical protein